MPCSPTRQRFELPVRRGVAVDELAGAERFQAATAASRSHKRMPKPRFTAELDNCIRQRHSGE
jgi:hypothetical protein